MPCLAAVAAIQRETSWKWMTFSIFYLTALAWGIATLFYQLATFAKHPVPSAIWAGGILVSMLLFGGGLKLVSMKKG